MSLAGHTAFSSADSQPTTIFALSPTQLWRALCVLHSRIPSFLQLTESHVQYLIICFLQKYVLCTSNKNWELAQLPSGTSNSVFIQTYA